MVGHLVKVLFTLIVYFQDPTNVDKFNMSSFHHLKNNLKIDEDGEPTFMYIYVCKFALVHLNT